MNDNNNDNNDNGDEFQDGIRSDNDTNNDDENDDDDDDDDDDDEGEHEVAEAEVVVEDADDGEETDTSSDADSISLGPVPLPDDVMLEYTYPNDFDGGRRSWRDIVEDGRFFRLFIDPSCTDIPYHKFSNCTLLIEVVFLDGSTLIRIGAHSFINCENLQRINKLPEGLKRIGEFAFSQTSLEEVVIPSTVILVGLRCFANCDSLRRVEFVELSTTTATAIAAAVVELEACVFCFCVELRSVRLPQNMVSIPYGCFHSCPLLTDVPIPVAVREIEQHSFQSCTSLTSIDLSENIELIEREAYANCTSLVRVTIRSSSWNLRIDEHVFNGCSALSSMTVFPSVWSKLFQSMNNEEHPNFIYKFLRDYHYQIDRLIEWKKADGAFLVPSSSESLNGATENNAEEKRRRLR